ncbi:hypothetical protein GVAV_000542 [Gurleya vavrai]
MNFRKQAAYCSKNKIPFIVILGENELKEGVVQIAKGDGAGEKQTVKKENISDFFNSKL